LHKRDEGANDLTIFRKFPLIQQYYNLHLTSAWFGFLMMDNLFFLDKVQTGPYWHANELYGLKLRKFWELYLKKYVNELLKQACTGTNSILLPDHGPQMIRAHNYATASSYQVSRLVANGVQVEHVSSGYQIQRESCISCKGD